MYIIINPMKKIYIAYFHGTKFENLPWVEGTTFDHSTKKRNQIINKCLSLGYHIMLMNGADNTEIVYIDNKRFRQR